MKCKNCRHEIRKTIIRITLENGFKNDVFYRHLGFLHNDNCKCRKPEPKEEAKKNGL